MPLWLPPNYEETIERDGIVRPDTTAQKLARLKPVFDPVHGTVSAGNSSPLTDGASALLLMEESQAKALGYTPLAAIRAWAFVGIDPAWQLLMGPAVAIPKALDKAGLVLGDLDLLDMHEAFSVQVLSNVQALGSQSFAKKRLGRAEALGELEDERINIYGGSVALGHPFAATGARQLLTMARELDRRGGGMATVSQCAAGGLGAAMVLEGC